MNLFKLEELFKEADEDIKNGFFEVAFQKLEDILLEEPTYGKAFNHLGWLYETKLRDYKKAEDCYEKALAYSPEYPAVYTNYSILLSSIQKYDKLEEVLNKGMNAPGVDTASMHYEFGIMREQQGRLEDAIKSYKTCLTMTLKQDTMDRCIESMKRCEIKKQYI